MPSGIASSHGRMHTNLVKFIHIHLGTMEAHDMQTQDTH